MLILRKKFIIKNCLIALLLFFSIVGDSHGQTCPGGYSGHAGTDYQSLLEVLERFYLNSTNPHCSYSGECETSINLHLNFLCDDGTIRFGILEGGYKECKSPDKRLPDGQCVLPFPDISPVKQQGCTRDKTGTTVGNPCDPSSGNKYESATDYRGNGLSFTRSYNSLVPKDGALGFGWTGLRYKHLDSISATQLTVYHADGKGEAFTKSGAVWTGDADTDRILTETASGYAVALPSGQAEQYDTSGRLVSETDRNGKVTAYGYNASNQLVSVTGPFGHVLQLSYDANNHLSRLTDPGGQVIDYTYDANNNLSTVSYPDGGLRLYHYENATYPHHLTGITDENGNRYSTFTYDSEGRATFTGHAQTDNGAPQEGFNLDYNSWGVQ